MAGRLAQWLDDFLHDVRSGARNLRRYPVAAAVAVVSLAAGIGATTATLTIRNAVFHKAPPDYRDPSQLSRIQVDRIEQRIQPFGSAVPAPLFAIWRDQFGDSIAGATLPRGERDLRTSDRTLAVPHRAVTANLFQLLGVEPTLGGSFAETGPTGDSSPPIVLSHRVWHRAFDGRPDVVGQTVWLDHQPHTVIGVMPQRFWSLDMNSPVWTLADPRRLTTDESVDAVLRRGPGTTPAMLAAQLQRGLAAYSAQSADTQQRHLRVSGIEGTPVGHSVAIVLPYVLGMSVVLTLLISCANVATLMIAQWTSREHEIAIRASIGASRGRIVRSLLTESVLLSILGAALGVCATFAMRSWILSRGDDVAFFDFTIDLRILFQTMAIALVTGMVAGVGPALYETRRLHTNPLRSITGADRVRQRWRHALVVFEIVVTMALLVTATAMIDAYQRARRTDVGFSTRPLMALRVEDARGVGATHVLEVLDGLPGVASAAASTSIPMTTTGPRERMATDAAGANGVTAERVDITPEFFNVLGVSLRAGRLFSTADSPAAGTAIASEALAARLFPGGSALGAQVWIGSSPYDIVGITADYASNPLRSSGEEPRLFLPLARDSKEVTRLGFLVRAANDPAPLVQGARRSVRDAGAGTVLSANTLDQIALVIGQEILVGTTPLVPLIAIGILLTSAGIYGVLAFALTRRARELAIRVAIGASGGDLARLIAFYTLRLVMLGSVLGLGATFALVALVRSSGGAGSIFDPPLHAFLVPLGIVLAIGAIVTWLPARRAFRVDPVVLLRTQ